jgi:hypothetical protein
MARFQIANTQSSVVLGTYEAADEAGALDAMARTAGYADFADACRVAPIVEGEMLVVRVD